MSMAKTSFATTKVKTVKRNRAPQIVLALLFITSLISIGFIGYKERSEPTVVFTSMLENNLRTTSVTKTVHQEGNGQSVDQAVQLLASPKHLAVGHTLLQQGSLGSTSIETESLGTPTTDYVRYVSIETDQKNTEGKELDFSAIMNLWGKSSSTQTPAQTTGELYGESVLGVVPLANLSKPARERVMQTIKDSEVYVVDYESVKKSTENGRPVYTYQLKVIPEGYIKLLKQFGREVGLTQLERLDPNTYKNSTPLEFSLTVDVLSRRLSKITFQNGREENYGSYGAKNYVKLPEQTISIDELQSRIQSVQ
jgi:hypothetical protein